MYGDYIEKGKYFLFEFDGIQDVQQLLEMNKKMEVLHLQHQISMIQPFNAVLDFRKSTGIDEAAIKLMDSVVKDIPCGKVAKVGANPQIRNAYEMLYTKHNKQDHLRFFDDITEAIAWVSAP